MMEPFYVGAYWGSRRESSLRGGERLAQCVARLGLIDEALGSWYRTAYSKAAAKTPVGFDVQSLAQLLAEGRNRRDDNGEVIEELGFSFGVWNRARPEIGMSGLVGAYPSGLGVLNCFVLSFPPPRGEALRLYDLVVAEAIFEAVVASWEPDWATWTSSALREAQGAAGRVPVVGWLTYVARPVGSGVPGVRSFGGGSIITLAREVAEVDIRAVHETRSLLAKAGALQPIP